MRLIDADKAVEQINEWLDQTGAIPLNTSYHFELLGCIEDCPTIDAVPVVRGEWKLYGNDDDSGMSYWCTACNFQLSEDLFYAGYNGRWIENGVFKYCPNCGAKMEVEPSIFFEKEPKPAIEKYNAQLTHILDEEYCNLLDDYVSFTRIVLKCFGSIIELAKEWEQRIVNKAE